MENVIKPKTVMIEGVKKQEKFYIFKQSYSCINVTSALKHASILIKI